MRKITIPVPDELRGADDEEWNAEQPTAAFSIHFSEDTDETRRAFKRFVEQLEEDGHDVPADWLSGSERTRIKVEVELAGSVEPLEVYGPPVVAQPDTSKGPMALLEDRIAEADARDDRKALGLKGDDDGPGS